MLYWRITDIAISALLLAIGIGIIVICSKEKTRSKVGWGVSLLGISLGLLITLWDVSLIISAGF